MSESFDTDMGFQDELYSKITRPVDLFADCVEWEGKINSSGYGILDRGQFAHRISFLIHNGRIPDGFEIDHLCRNKKCVNPYHLEAVSQRLNHQRRIYQRSPDNS